LCFVVQAVDRADDRVDSVLVDEVGQGLQVAACGVVGGVVSAYSPMCRAAYG
jgi:hypothetical protein